MTWQEAVAVAVGEPVGLGEVRRHSSCHLPATIFTHQATLPGTGWHRLIGLSVRMTSWSWVVLVQSSKANGSFNYICLYQCQHMKSKAIQVGEKNVMVHSNRSTRGHCGLKLSTKVKPWSNKHHPQCHWMSCKVFRMSKGWVLLKWLSQNVVKVLLFQGTEKICCCFFSAALFRVSTADHLPPSHPISTNLFCQPTLWISSFTISMDFCVGFLIARTCQLLLVQ